MYCVLPKQHSDLCVCIRLCGSADYESGEDELCVCLHRRAMLALCGGSCSHGLRSLVLGLYDQLLQYHLRLHRFLLILLTLRFLRLLNLPMLLPCLG